MSVIYMTACHIYYCTLISCFIVVLPKSLAPVVKQCVFALIYSWLFQSLPDNSHCTCFFVAAPAEFQDHGLQSVDGHPQHGPGQQRKGA